MRRCCLSQPWVQRTQAMAVVCVALAPVARASETDLKPDDLELGIRFWDPSLSVTLGGGYKDNVTLSHAAPEPSAFSRVGLEATLLRLPFDGTQVSLLLGGEDTRYLTSKSVNHEDNAYAQAEVRRFAGDWQLAFAAEAGYLDQIVDLSVTEFEQQAVPLKGVVLTGRPILRRDFPGFWMSVETPGSYESFKPPVDDYWEFGPRFTVGQTFANKSEVAVSYAFTYRAYSSQLARDSDGELIPGLVRAGYQHDAGIALKNYWDEKQRWRSLTRFSFRQSSDNASGYFDYRRAQVAEQLRFQTKVWLVSGEVRLAQYEFPGQPLGGPGTEQRLRTEVIFNARAERQIVKHVRLYAQFDHEQVFSNLKLDEYEVNTFSGGLMVEF